MKTIEKYCDIKLLTFSNRSKWNTDIQKQRSNAIDKKNYGATLNESLVDPSTKR